MQPLRSAGQLSNGFAWPTACAAACQILKTQEPKKRAVVMDFL